MIEGEVMIEAGVRNAGTTSATGIKDRRSTFEDLS
jgi:hypothetical protein